MYDLIVTGGLAVLPSSTADADIAISGEKIVGIGAPGGFAATGAKRTIDAKGQIVMPGGIDPHVHCGWPIVVPGITNHMLSGPPEQVSRAALHGGTTTVLDFAVCPNDEQMPAAIRMRMK